jgi:hypothetical protein
MALPAVDPDATQAIVAPTPVAAAAAPYTARPVGAAHPRRRFGRGLVLTGLALLVTGAGIGAVALGSAQPIRAAAAGTTSGGPSASSAATPAAGLAGVAGDQIGRGVDPSDPTATPALPDVSVVESPTITRVPTTVVTSMPPATTTPPPTTPPPTTPATTTPPTTAPPTTTPTVPTFTTLTVPSTVDCPSPYADAYATFTWNAPGATEVMLSIDGPGGYRTYDGPTGTETVFFPCSTAHTYLFTAYGAGGAVTTAQFTVTPS